MQQNHQTPDHPEILALLVRRPRWPGESVDEPSLVSGHGEGGVAIDGVRVEVVRREDEGEAEVEEQGVESPEEVEGERNVLRCQLVLRRQ